MTVLRRILTGLFVVLLASIPLAGTADAAPKAAVGGGTSILIDGRYLCTVTTVGHDRTGRLVGLTAGHCGNLGSTVRATNNRAAGIIGRFSLTSPDGDFAVLTLDPNRVRPVRTVGKAHIRSVGTFPAPGANVCKSGQTTGFSCGPVLGKGTLRTESYVCANHGDSGGPVLKGNRVVGMLNGGLEIGGVAVGCVHPAIPIYTPMVATKMTVIVGALNRHGGIGAGFRPI